MIGLLLRLEALQEEQIRKALEPKEKTVQLDDQELPAALLGASFFSCSRSRPGS